MVKKYKKNADFKRSTKRRNAYSKRNANMRNIGFKSNVGQRKNSELTQNKLRPNKNLVHEVTRLVVMNDN